LAESGKERRVHPRKDVSLRVRVKADNVDDFVDQFAHNISKGGLFLRSQKPYPVNTELQFEIQLKDGSSVLRGKGKVTWSQPPAGPGEKQRTCGMGVKFMGLDAESRALVMRILEHKEELNSPPTPAPSREPAASPTEESGEGPTVEVEITPPEQVPVEPAPAKPEPAPVAQRSTPALPFWRRVPLRVWLLMGGAALGAVLVLLFMSLPADDATAFTPLEKEPVAEKTNPPAPLEPPVEPAVEEPEIEVAPEIEPLPIPKKRRIKKRRVKRRFGYLSLNTNPWVEVYLGSRKLGVTPLVRVRLRAGLHRLKLVNWEKEINSTFMVNIRPGKTTKQVKRFSH
jgi:uncharacterized protein (TIGR02266 family)